MSARTANAGRTPSAKGCLGGFVGILAVVAFVASMMTTIIGVGIWPGEAKLVAPIVCPDDQPDAFVVSDTYKPTPGETTINYTMYCVGPRGDFTDVGFFKPLVLLTVMHALILLAIVALFALPRLLARRVTGRDDSGTATGQSGGPPNDSGPSASSSIPQSPIISGAVDHDPGSSIIT